MDSRGSGWYISIGHVAEGLMANDRQPIYGTLVFLGILLVALVVIQPYSADWPGSRYTGPARRYIRAAMRQDSATLVRLSTSESPVRWALAAARRHPDILMLWEGRIEAFTGERRGDTTEVFVYPYPIYRACKEEPITLRFVGSGTGSKVLEASSPCLNPG
jgi:hypothetical protein